MKNSFCSLKKIKTLFETPETLHAIRSAISIQITFLIFTVQCLAKKSIQGKGKRREKENNVKQPKYNKVAPEISLC